MLSMENVRTIKAELEVKITDEDLGDIVCTALCGGIGYWACLDNTKKEWESFDKEDCIDEIATKILLNGEKLYFVDTEEDTTLALTLDKLLDGIKRVIISDTTLISNGELDTCNIDANIADSIFQYAMLGEIVYG